MTAPTVDDYLERIGADRDASLAELHERHLCAVPFENFDIHGGVPIVLDETHLLDKIVTRRRGGFCYELNGCFAWLLRQLGHDVDLLNAEVVKRDGTFGIPYDHLTLRVGDVLCDVGFGKGFLRPIPLDSLRRDGDWLHVDTQYRFTLQPCEFADFAGACEHHQTSPESSFTKGRVYAIARPSGWVRVTERQTGIDDFEAAVAALTTRTA